MQAQINFFLTLLTFPRATQKQICIILSVPFTLKYFSVEPSTIFQKKMKVLGQKIFKSTLKLHIKKLIKTFSFICGLVNLGVGDENFYKLVLIEYYFYGINLLIEVAHRNVLIQTVLGLRGKAKLLGTILQQREHPNSLSPIGTNLSFSLQETFIARPTVP